MGNKFVPLFSCSTDDLGQNGVGKVFARLGVVDDEVSFGPDHFGEVLEGHIGACVGIVEPAVRVFLDYDRAVLLVGIQCHVSSDSLALGGAQAISCRNCEIS